MASYTKLYLIPGDGVINRPTTWKGSWNSTASAQDVWIDGVKDRSDNTARSAAEAVATNPFDVAIMRCTSRPLEAQTITGSINYVLGLLESNALADFTTKIHVYIRVGETDAIRATLLNNFVDSAEWPTTSTGTQLGAGSQALTTADAEDGDTLVIEIGYRSTNTSTTSRTGTIRRGCMSTAEGFTALPDMTVGSTSTTTEAGYFVFSNALSFKENNNNAFTTPTTLSASLTESYSMRPAIRTGDEPEPCDGGPATTHARYNSAWYAWDCPTDQSATVSADIANAASTFGTCLMVVTGTPGAFTIVDCRAENDPSFETITFAAAAGTTYYIVVTSVYYGGGDLTFTFTPSVAPSSDETVLSLRLSGTTYTTATAMGWKNLIGANASTRHFWYAGKGTTPFVPGDAYVWIGTDIDGVTLTLNIYDGTTLTSITGPVLSLNVWYHWTYIKDNQSHKVYLSSADGIYDGSLVFDTTAALDFVPGSQFVYAAATTMIPKAFKSWTISMDPAQIPNERDNYAAVYKTGLDNVVKFQTDTTTTWTNYSGYDWPISALIGSDDPWEIIRGPNLPTLPSRPFSDDFESYAEGEYTGSAPFVGTVDPAKNYEYFTDFSFACWVQAGVGISSSQAFVTRQADSSIWFEHDSYAGRCGYVAVWSYKKADIQPDLNHGCGITIEAVPDGGLTAPDTASFGFLDVPDQTTTPTPLRFFNHYDGTVVTVPDVYVLAEWQYIQLYFTLSTITEAQTDVNPDGSVTILFNGTTVLSQTGLKLTLDNSRWASNVNTWDRVSFAWGGYIDGLNIDTTCFSDVSTSGTAGCIMDLPISPASGRNGCPSGLNPSSI